MISTSLIIAIVFASLFGFFTICFAMWCVGCYMYRHCFDLGQYFRTWPPQPVQPTSVVCAEKCCSREGKSMRGRRQDRLYMQREYEHQDCEQGRMRDGDARPLVQHPIQAHDAPCGQPYRPSLKRNDRVQNRQPMMQEQMPMHWQGQGTIPASPFVTHLEVPQQPSRQMVPRILKPLQGLPQYQPPGLLPCLQPHEGIVGSKAFGAHEQKNFSAKGQSPVKHASRARRVDYIHICDEYPPIVLEALKKAAPASPTASSSASSSSSSNESGTTQEIPRTDMAWSMPDYTTKSPVQSPRYCHFATDARDLSR